MTLAILLPSSFPDSLSQLLFEQHWLYWIPLALAGLVLVLFARGPGASNIRRAGLGMIILATLWILLAALFVTPRERLAAAHRRILQAAENADPQTVIDLLAPEFRFGPTNRPAMADTIQAVLKSIKAKSNLLRFYEATLNGALAEVHINILTTLDGPNPGPWLTKWELDWKDAPPDAANPDGWQLTEIHRWWVSNGADDQVMPNNFNEMK